MGDLPTRLPVLGRRAARRFAVIVLVCAAVTGCKKRWQAVGAQPELYLGMSPLTRTSTELAITFNDMHLPSFVRLNNTAHFVVVSKDRIRVRVKLVHRWQEMTDLSRWKAWLEDGDGRVVHPVAVEARAAHPIYEVKYVPRLERNRAYEYRYPVDLWSGGGDYVFYSEDLYNTDLQKLALVMQRRGYEYRYTWHFVDSENGEPIQRKAAKPVGDRVVVDTDSRKAGGTMSSRQRGK